MRRFGRLLVAAVVWVAVTLALAGAASAKTLGGGSTTWGEDSTIMDDRVTIDATVTVTKDITLTIPEGKTLEVSRGIDAGTHTLTVKGKGALVVHGVDQSSKADGGDGIKGNLVVDGPTVTVTGGSGAPGYDAYDYEGYAGGAGVRGDLTVVDGEATVTGGSGGSGNDGRNIFGIGDASGAGNGGNGVEGSVTVSGGVARVTGGAGGVGGKGGVTNSGAGGDGGDGGSGGNGAGGSVTVSGGVARVTGGAGGGGGKGCAGSSTNRIGGAGGTGGAGGRGVGGPVTVSGGEATVTGGAGGDGSNGGNGGFAAFGDNGGNGGAGGCGAGGPVTLRGGKVAAYGGDGGAGGNGGNGGDGDNDLYAGYGGNGGAGGSGGNGAEESVTVIEGEVTAFGGAGGAAGTAGKGGKGPDGFNRDGSGGSGGGAGQGVKGEIINASTVEDNSGGADDDSGDGSTSKERYVRVTRTEVTGTSRVASRLWGDDRYGTCAAVVGEAFPASGWAVLASGRDFADALAASGLAGAHEAPVVLTAPGRLGPEARGQLERLGVSSVTIMGGESSVSAAVEAELKAMGISCERVSGAERLSTSVAALRRLRSADASSDTVVVATGYGFADALSIGPWCWATRSPVVLAGTDGLLSGEAVEAIKADGGLRRVVVVGGDASVSAAVADQLGLEVVRLAGADRYATSRAVAEWAASNGLGFAHATVATGRTFPDALAGAALAGSTSSVLVVADRPSDATVGLLGEHVSEVSQAYVLGGASSVPDEVLDAIA